ncbi:MAG: hypothetical protein JJV91_02285 [Desulfosarcina sp.]|nr:hypothetical protein [Desulfobacterales bacterium]
MLLLLTQAGRRVVALSRQARKNVDSGVEWQVLSTSRPGPLPSAGLRSVIPPILLSE